MLQVELKAAYLAAMKDGLWAAALAGRTDFQTVAPMVAHLAALWAAAMAYWLVLNMVDLMAAHLAVLKGACWAERWVASLGILTVVPLAAWKADLTAAQQVGQWAEHLAENLVDGLAVQLECQWVAPRVGQMAVPRAGRLDWTAACWAEPLEVRWVVAKAAQMVDLLDLERC